MGGKNFDKNSAEFTLRKLPSLIKSDGLIVCGDKSELALIAFLLVRQ